MTRVSLPKWLKELYGSVNKGRVAFRRWKGRVVLEVDPSPSYVRTTAQDRVRSWFKQGIEQWHKLTPEEKEYYNQEARKYGLTGYQYFMSLWMRQIPEIKFNVEVTITEQSGTDLTDYQVLLQVTNDPNFFNALGTDPTKLEVYDQDKATLLPFYIEEWDSNNYNAKIWIKVPSIPANGTKKVYLYSNPSRTTPLSDPKAVFDFYDDFSQDTSANYTKGSTYCYKTAIFSITWDSAEKALKLMATEDTGHIVAIAPYQLNGKFAIKARVKYIYATLDNQQAGIGIQDDTYQRIFRCIRNPGANLEILQITQLTSSGETELDSYSYVVDENYHIYELKYNGTQLKGIFDGQITLTANVSLSFPQDLLLFSYANELNEGALFDYIIVRKYTEPEPSVSYTIL